METNAVKLENGNYGCPKCKSEEFRNTGHIDFVDKYQNMYICVKCGTGVWVSNNRDKESMYYWADEDMEE